MTWRERTLQKAAELDAAGDAQGARDLVRLVEMHDNGQALSMEEFGPSIMRYDTAGESDTARAFVQLYDAMPRNTGAVVENVNLGGPDSGLEGNASRVESGLRGAVQGASLGTSDEIAAYGQTVLDVTGLGRLGDNITGLGVRLFEGDEASDRFAARTRENREQRRGRNLRYFLDKERDLNFTAQQSNPVTFGASEILSGGVTGAAGIAKGVGKNTFKKSARRPGVKKETMKEARDNLRNRAMGIGAVEGGIAGIGYSDSDDPIQTIIDGAIGSTLGGALGRYGDIALSPLVASGRAAKNTVVDLVNPRANAAREIARDLDADELTIEQVQAQLNRAAADETPLIPADVSKGLRDRLGAAANQPGGNLRGLETLLDTRMRTQRDRVLSRLSSRVGGDDVIAEFGKQIDALEQSAKPLYVRAYNTPIQFTDEMNAVLKSPAAKGVRSRVNDLMQNDIALGRYAPEEVMGKPMAELHYTIRALRDVGSEIGLGSTTKDQARALATRLGNELKKQNPAFKQAQSVWADKASQEAAAEFGGKLWNQKTRSARKTWEAMSDSERIAARIGFIDDVMHRLGQKREGTNQVMDFDKKNLQDKLTMLFGDDPKFMREFFQAVGDEADMAQTLGRALRNSTTANNLSRYKRFGSDISTGMAMGGAAGMYLGPSFMASGAAAGAGAAFMNRYLAERSSGKLIDLLTDAPNFQANMMDLLPNRYDVSPTGLNLGGAAIGGGAAGVDRLEPVNRPPGG